MAKKSIFILKMATNLRPLTPNHRNKDMEAIESFLLPWYEIGNV